MYLCRIDKGRQDSAQFYICFWSTEKINIVVLFEKADSDSFTVQYVQYRYCSSKHVACKFPGFIHQHPTLCDYTVNWILWLNSNNRNKFCFLVLYLSEDGVRTDFFENLGLNSL